ncbi:uncharacterized protein BX664DRAFT_341981 [Halteromyces radiatus]|uniref:uncharacterized protein n=1 Tax=Halteromyces radiatus TaxID=101107 RepID=UPI00221FE22B|nr:uncharacterized protein BX664DRAFT_341981 [Halteromyces radiatus]KAI8079980.1 hypothetical protein BX664DRAFT_341981 [Halteromyces radiatus]
MLFKFLLAIAMMVCLMNVVNAGFCCGDFSADCCGKCTSGNENGQECTLRGNPHDVKCGASYCPSYDTQGCEQGWRC